MRTRVEAAGRRALAYVWAADERAEDIPSSSTGPVAQGAEERAAEIVDERLAEEIRDLLTPKSLDDGPLYRAAMKAVSRDPRAKVTCDEIQRLVDEMKSLNTWPSLFWGDGQ